jgi:hypothetical protein
MEPKDFIPIVGWIVVFCLGILSAVIVARLTKKRKILAWASVAENELVPKQLSDRLGIPVVLKVGTETPTSLTTIQLRIGSGGNDTASKAV